MAVTKTTSQIGQAGEYLAASVLQHYFPVIAIPHISAVYDLAVQTSNGRFLRIQVKTSDRIERLSKHQYYRFHTHRDIGRYSDDEIDFFAFVALPARMISFQRYADITPSGVFRIRKDQATFEKEQESIKKTLAAFL